MVARRVKYIRENANDEALKQHMKNVEFVLENSRELHGWLIAFWHRTTSTDGLCTQNWLKQYTHLHYQRAFMIKHFIHWN